LGSCGCRRFRGGSTWLEGLSEAETIDLAEPDAGLGVGSLEGPVCGGVRRAQFGDGHDVSGHEGRPGLNAPMLATKPPQQGQTLSERPVSWRYRSR